MQVVAFDEPLMNFECNIVESYLSQKYGIRLAGGGGARAGGGDPPGVRRPVRPGFSIGQRLVDGLVVKEEKEEGGAAPAVPSKPTAGGPRTSSSSDSLSRGSAQEKPDSEAAPQRANAPAEGGGKLPPPAPKAVDEKPKAVDGDGFVIEKPRAGNSAPAGASDITANACTGSKDPFAGRWHLYIPASFM